MKIRIYGKTLETWKHEDERGRMVTVQRELAYREYDSETGELVGVGSEDFSQARWKSEIEGRFIWTWDGERRNKGGHRWFEEQGYITYRKSDRKEVKRYLNNMCGAVELQLR